MFNLKYKNEKGSITLYVLVAMLLMISVLTIVYMQINQRNNNQLKEISNIQREYQTNDSIMDDNYNEIIDKGDVEIYIVLTTPDGKQYDINQWTNQDLNLKIYYPEGVSDDEKYYYKDGEKLKYTENEIIEDNCTIRAEYRDVEKEVKVTKIDKILPTVTLEPNGGDKTISVGNTTANISVKVEGEDNKSGVKTIEYQISTSETTPSENDSNWKEIENGGTISENKEGGKYYIYTKVTDNAGNVNIQKSQEYNINYEVGYDANGGSGVPSAQTKVHGTALTLSSTKPTRTGYTFLGWSTISNATAAQYQPGGSYTEDKSVMLYAVWQVNSYTVRYDNNYMSNNIIPNVVEPSTYLGWRVTTTNTAATDSSAIDKTAIKITFPGYDGRSGVQKELSNDLTIGKTYTFSVYLKASRNHNNVVIGPQQGGTTTVNVTTSWQKFTYTFIAKSNQYSSFVIYSSANESETTDRWNNGDILYVSGLELMEGTYNNYKQDSKPYNTSLGTLDTPTRNGYTFDGWYTAPIGGTKISSLTTVPAYDVTYYAHWVDKVGPTIGNLTLSTTNWTKNNITITGEATDVGSGTSYYQFSANDNLTASSGGWQKITNTKSKITKTFTASTNDTYYFYAKDQSGNVSKKSILVNRIDKIAPTINIGTNGGTYVIASGSTTATISTKLTANDTGGSGLNTLQYAWSTSNSTAPSAWSNFTNSRTISSKRENSLYYLWVKVTDKAGNSKQIVSNAYKVFNNITFSKSNNNITAENISVTVSYGNTLTSQYVKQYSFNNSTWSTYSNKLTITDSCTVYARIYDTTNKKVIVQRSLNISNIKDLALQTRLYVSSRGLDSSWSNMSGQKGNPKMDHLYVDQTSSEYIFKIEGMYLAVKDGVPSDSIQVNTHTSNVGWQGYKNASSSNVFGQPGINEELKNSNGLYYYPYGIEAIQMKVKDSLKNKYSIRYRVLNPYTKKWSSWASDGSTAGSVETSQPICAIEVQIQRK